MGYLSAKKIQAPGHWRQGLGIRMDFDALGCGGVHKPLAESNQTSRRKMAQIISSMARAEGLDEKLKAKDQIALGRPDGQYPAACGRNRPDRTDLRITKKPLLRRRPFHKKTFRSRNASSLLIQFFFCLTESGFDVLSM